MDDKGDNCPKFNSKLKSYSQIYNKLGIFNNR